MAGKSAFDELWGASRGRKARPGFERARRLAFADPVRRARSPPARRRKRASAISASPSTSMATPQRPSGSSRSTSSRACSPRAEWDQIVGRARAARARDQRVHRRRLRARGGSSPTASIPADIILGNSQYCIPMAGVQPPHGIYAHICGIDLVRTGADDFFVLEDNARTPSGVSYMLENREAMLRLCPELFDLLPVRPVDTYPDLLLDTLHSVAPQRRAPAGLRAADPGPLQFGLLRAQLPRRQYGHRAGRGLRSRGRRRHRLDADDRRPRAGRRDLPPDRRRLSRSLAVQPRLDARRRRADGRLSGGQCHDRQRARHRHRRRQGDLFLHARDRPLLFGRGAQASQSSRPGAAASPRRSSTRSTISASWW